MVLLLITTPSPNPTPITGVTLESLAPWIPAAAWGGLITSAVAVAALIFTVIQNSRSNKQFLQSYQHSHSAFSNTLREQELNRDRQFRSQVYRDFLVQESSRSDAYISYSTVRKRRTREPGKKGTSAENARLEAIEREIALAAKKIDEARAATWASLSAIQMLGSPGLLKAARAYDKAVSAANPMRERQSAVPLDFGRKRDLIFAYITEARKELGLVVVTEDEMFWNEQAELSMGPGQQADQVPSSDPP